MRADTSMASALILGVNAQKYMGPYPAQLVVVMAVRKAVRAATTIFTATSISRVFFITQSS